MGDRLGCALCGAEAFASGAQLVCMACWQDKLDEIERLRAKRDEARDAARHYREMWGHLYVDDKFDMDVWPWLKEATNG